MAGTKKLESVIARIRLLAGNVDGTGTEKGLLREAKRLEQLSTAVSTLISRALDASEAIDSILSVEGYEGTTAEGDCECDFDEGAGCEHILARQTQALLHEAIRVVAPQEVPEDFWSSMNRLAYEERAQRDGVSKVEARRRIISEFAKAHGVTFTDAARRTERPDGAR